jgi:hypothetical protein
MKMWLTRFSLGVFIGTSLGALLCALVGPSMLSSVPDLTSMFSASMCACKETAEKTTSVFANLQLISMAIGGVVGGSVGVAVNRMVARKERALKAEQDLASRTAPPPSTTSSII